MFKKKYFEDNTNTLPFMNILDFIQDPVWANYILEMLITKNKNLVKKILPNIYRCLHTHETLKDTIIPLLNEMFEEEEHREAKIEAEMFSSTPSTKERQRLETENTSQNGTFPRSSATSSKKTSPETRFYKSKVPRDGNYTVLTEITGSNVKWRTPGNFPDLPGGWGPWIAPQKGWIVTCFGVDFFTHESKRRDTPDRWKFDYVGQDIIFRNKNRPNWINIDEAEYRQILEAGKTNAVRWSEEKNIFEKHREAEVEEEIFPPTYSMTERQQLEIEELEKKLLTRIEVEELEKSHREEITEYLKHNLNAL